MDGSFVKKENTTLKYKSKYVSASELAEVLNCTPNVVNVLPNMYYSQNKFNPELATRYIIVYLDDPFAVDKE